MTEEIKKIDEDLGRLQKGLTLQQIKWCGHVLEGMTPNEAGIECGMIKSTTKDAVTKINTLMQSPRIRLYMDAMRRKVAARAVLSIEEIDAAWSDIATVDAVDIVELGEMFQPLGETGMPSGAPVQVITLKQLNNLTTAQRRAIKSITPCPGGVRIEMHDKMKALEMLAKRHQAFTEKVDVNHTGNVQVVTYVGDNGRGEGVFRK